MASGISAEPDPLTAAANACERLLSTPKLPRSQPDLVYLFVSSHHAWSMRTIGAHVQRLLNPTRLVGTTAESVLGSSHELEGAPGIALLAMWLPGVTVSPFLIDDLVLDNEQDIERQRESIRRVIDAGPELRAIVCILDPYSVPVSRLLPALNDARTDPRAPIIGGMASAPRTPDGGGNVLLIDDRMMDRGGVGVSFSGPLRVDAVVSQGCRPIGPNLVITKARGNLILELGTRPALQVVQELLAELREDERNALKRGLLMGRVVDEYKERFGVGDYLIRAMVGADKEHSAIAVSETVRVGQTVRLHVRDADTATSDLSMLLDGQKLHGRPAGALVFTCNMRGRRLFPSPAHDVGSLQRAFKATPDGAALAKGGTAIATDTHELPIAGFFASGEIGPVGRDAYFHAHTASIAIFRDP
ncbi:MAG: FIST C-terminal domain-containing protein [Phycisphaeraceae bacterium]|nr:FIST C-terminal domain-containing protein [Phycisphaeraceae bacterium]